MENGDIPTENTEIADDGLHERIPGVLPGSPFEDHSFMDPGLLEVLYEACLDYEFRAQDLKVESHPSKPTKEFALVPSLDETICWTERYS